MLESLSRWAAGAARRLGLHVQRWHDPYLDFVGLAAQPVRQAIDGGAHLGSITHRMLAAFPCAFIHAFEPQSDSFQALEKAFAGEPRVHVWHAALGRDNTVAALNINKACYSSLLSSLDPPAMCSTGRVEQVPVLRLDDWSAANAIAPEFIKLDLQGYEMQALEGAHKILRESVRAVLCEVNFVRRYAHSPLFHEVTALLDSHGFQLYRLYEIWGGPRGGYQQGDALYVKRPLLIGASGQSFALP